MRRKYKNMKFISWNVNGIRACITKGFEERFHELDADIFCLQETKCQQGQVKLELPGYHQYWNYANRRGYSGTAIFTKREPLSAVYGIGIEEHDKEGRVITLEFEEYYFVTVYTPNSQSELRRLEYRMKWEEDFLAYLLKLQEKKPVICCGDLNVAHQEIDLKNPKTNRKNAGFTDEERACFTRALESGFIDTFRYFYPDKEGAYSWWSYRFRAREKNAGWRIDYFLVENKEYIALLPLDENGQNETGEVYLYSFSRTADGDPMLANIEDDEEYDAAANAFNAVVEKARADEEADAPLS